MLVTKKKYSPKAVTYTTTYATLLKHSSRRENFFLYQAPVYRVHLSCSLAASNLALLSTRNTTSYTKVLFTSPVFSPLKDVGICGDLVFNQYSQIPSNTLS
jgi:hypothetical protein